VPAEILDILQFQRGAVDFFRVAKILFVAGCFGPFEMDRCMSAVAEGLVL